MDEMPKLLIIAGALLLIIGLLWQFGSKFGLGSLPGDINVEKGNFKFYFPAMTSIIISILLSLILFLIFWFRK